MPTELENGSTTSSLPLCACGCGEPVTKPGNTYLRGHRANYKSAKTLVKQQTKTSTDDSDAVLVQDMALAQQVIGKILKGNKDSNTINIITVGPIQIGSRSNGASKVTEERLSLPDALSKVFNDAIASGELPENDTERRIKWLVECEKVITR